MAMLNNQRVFIKKGLIPSSWRKLDVFEIWMGLGWWYAKSFVIYWCWEFMEPVESNVCRWLSWRISRCSGIYASDLKRAHHTAQIYGKALNCEALEDGDGVSFSQLCRLSFAFLLLYLFVVAGVDRLPSLGTTLDDGAKVTWNNLPSIAPLVYRYSFLFLRWNGFSLNMLWPIINYHLLLPRLHLMSCDYLLAVATPPSQLLPLLCSPLLVVVCPCLLFLGWTGCSFRDYSMRQRFFQVA